MKGGGENFSREGSGKGRNQIRREVTILHMTNEGISVCQARGPRRRDRYMIVLAFEFCGLLLLTCGADPVASAIRLSVVLTLLVSQLVSPHLPSN